MTGIDGRVNNLNQNVFNTLQGIKNRNQGQGNLSAADARELNNAIQADGRVDQNEADLLAELTQSSSRTINISRGAGNYSPSTLNFPTATGEARSILQQNSNTASRADLNRLWSQGAEGFAGLAEIYSRSPADARNVTNFLAEKVGQAWGESSVTNGYGPLRSLISTGMAGVNQLEGEANAQARRMVHGAIKQVDTNADGSDGAIPNFLYNWIRPGGYL